MANVGHLNTHFFDHYLDVPFDLSRVMFIATANTIDPIPEPLLDRLEILYLSGYTEEEKMNIAFKYLIPAEIEEAGLSDNPPDFTPEAIRKIIREYTREAGVRNLKRQIASICRKNARQRLRKMAEDSVATVTPETVERQLGTKKYYFEVADNDMISGPKVSSSRHYIARLPSLEELIAQTDSESRRRIRPLVRG